MPRKPPLAALTVHQPYAWALAGGWKPVENRDWPPGGNFIGRPLAIHGGLQYDEAAAEHLAAHLDVFGLPSAPPGRLEIAKGAIVAVATLAGFIEVKEDAAGDVKVERVFGRLSHQNAYELAASPWARGPWLWVLRDVVAIQPVLCRGYQKLWTVPEIVVPEVRRNFRLARSAGKAVANG